MPRPWRARALLAADPRGLVPTPTATSFDGAAEVRAAQPLADAPRRRSPQILPILLSLAGPVIVISPLMCVGQAVWAVLVS